MIMEGFKYLGYGFKLAMSKIGRATCTISWIDDDLAVGDMVDATCYDELDAMNITMIIDIRLYFSSINMDPKYFKLINFVGEMRELIDRGHKILIHCQAGIDRSPFVAMLYIAWDRHISFDDAYDIVSEKRPQTIQHDDWAREAKKWW